MLRLASDLSARSEALLALTRLSVEDDELVLRVSGERGDLLRGDKVRKRLGALAQALGLTARMDTA